MWLGCVGRDWWQSLQEPRTEAPMGHILDSGPSQIQERLQRVMGEAFVLWAVALLGGCGKVGRSGQDGRLALGRRTG